MSLEALAQNVIDVWNSKDIDQLRQLYGMQGSFFDPLMTKPVTGASIIHHAEGIYAAFPDLVFDLRQITIGENVAMAEWSQNGTNNGPIFGKPATGRYIEVPAVSVLNFSGNTLLSHRDYWDLKKLLNDLFG